MLKFALAASIAATLVSAPTFAQADGEYTNSIPAEAATPVVVAGAWDPAYSSRDRDLEKRAKGAPVTGHNTPTQYHSTWDPATNSRDRYEAELGGGAGAAVSSHNVPTTYIPNWDPAKSSRDRYLERR